MKTPKGSRDRVSGALLDRIALDEASARPGAAMTFAATFRPLRNYDYRLFYFGQMISLTGTWMQTVGQAWLVLDLTHSPLALGTVTML